MAHHRGLGSRIEQQWVMAVTSWPWPHQPGADQAVVGSREGGDAPLDKTPCRDVSHMCLAPVGEDYRNVSTGSHCVHKQPRSTVYPEPVPHPWPTSGALPPPRPPHGIQGGSGCSGARQELEATPQLHGHLTRPHTAVSLAVAASGFHLGCDSTMGQGQVSPAKPGSQGPEARRPGKVFRSLNDDPQEACPCADP